MQAEYTLSRKVLRNFASKLQKRGELLWKRRSSEDVFAEPYALGLALMVAARMYRVAASYKGSTVESLFDGGEDHGPNLHTTMKCIRDLCSASVWPARVQQVRCKIAQSNEPSVDALEGLSKFWRAILDQFANPCGPKVMREASEVMDDVSESLLAIAELLKAPKDRRAAAWDEISRHLEHARDHFDYAEAALIAVLRPGDEAT